MYFIKYSGDFGFIKPWTAARDSKTKSMDYLTPSILMGIEKKLFEVIDVNSLRIKRHRLQFSNISFQQEQTSSINYLNTKKRSGQRMIKKETSIISRGVLINPVLYLGFENLEDAEYAKAQHICLCRNEDVLFPTDLIEVDEDYFDNNEDYFGYESFTCDDTNTNGIYSGLNKYTNEKQYCERKIYGLPINLR